MAGRGTDRKGKNKDKTSLNEQADAIANFTLPGSLPCSEIQFPVIIRKAPRANWQEILKESEEALQEIEEYTQSKENNVIKSPFLKTECDYIKNEVFVHLIPALEETLHKANLWGALTRPKCFFNGLDHITQVLWNNNPRYPGRKECNLHLFNMPWVREHLKKNPRPYYPKSWLWPEEYAAALIQNTVRQYFVQKEEEVQEMRGFWKKLEIEKNYHGMDTNPYLAKKFASTQNVQKK